MSLGTQIYSERILDIPGPNISSSPVGTKRKCVDIRLHDYCSQSMVNISMQT